MPFGRVEERCEHQGIGGAAVVVSAPDPVGAQREGVQHAQGEAAGTAEVAPAGQVGGRQTAALDGRTHHLVRAVVDHENVIGTAALAGDRRKALGEEHGAVACDDDSGDHVRTPLRRHAQALFL
jgi:hypothetical protein